MCLCKTYLSKFLQQLPRSSCGMSTIIAQLAIQLQSICNIHTSGCLLLVTLLITAQQVRMVPLLCSQDRRKELVKQAGKLAEEGKVAVRNVRGDALKKVGKVSRQTAFHCLTQEWYCLSAPCYAQLGQRMHVGRQRVCPGVTQGHRASRMLGCACSCLLGSGKVCRCL